MVQIIPVDPHDERALRAWYEAMHSGASAHRSAPVVSTYAALAYSLRRPGPMKRRLPVAARDSDATVGALLLELPREDNLTTAAVEIDVPPLHRGRGVGAGLWDWAVERARAEHRTVFQAQVNVPAGQDVSAWPGIRFASRRGFTSRHVEDHLVLELSGHTVGGNGSDLLPQEPGYEVVSWIGACPDEHLESYADLQTGMARDVPVGKMTREATVWDAARVRTHESRMVANYQVIVSMAVTSRGEPVGYTLVFVARNAPEQAIQDDTFVLHTHRGHHLGTMLKVANTHQVRRHVPGSRWLHTWTAESNAAMQRVNARFGFRVVETLHEMEWTSPA